MRLYWKRNSLWQVLYFMQLVFLREEVVFHGVDDDVVGGQEHGKVSTRHDVFRPSVAFADLSRPAQNHQKSSATTLERVGKVWHNVHILPSNTPVPGT